MPSGCNRLKVDGAFSWVAIQGNEKASPSAGPFCCAPYFTRATSAQYCRSICCRAMLFPELQPTLPRFRTTPSSDATCLMALRRRGPGAPSVKMGIGAALGSHSKLRPFVASQTRSSHRKLLKIMTLLSIWPHDETVPHPLCPTHMRHQVGRRSLVPAAVQFLKLRICGAFRDNAAFKVWYNIRLSMEKVHGKWHPHLVAIARNIIHRQRWLAGMTKEVIIADENLAKHSLNVSE